MSYADFTLSRLVKQFSLTLEEDRDLYCDFPAATIRPEFEAALAETMPLAVRVSTEKARSEFLIAPVLAEFWKLTGHRVGLHSGVDFTVEPENGLAGVCDYIITRSPEQFYVVSPIIVLVEAKSEDLKRGYAQCFAEMLAAQRFNEREGSSTDRIFGAVTVGQQWKFLEIEGAAARIDTADYYLKDLGKIIGILLGMSDCRAE